MKVWTQFCLPLARTVCSWIFSFALWTCWLALAIVLAAQCWILASREFSLPDFALRQLEAQLAESGLRATFGRASFDPAGRILIENVRVSLPAFPEPVLTTRSVFLRVNPASLLAGRIEASELQLSGVSVFAPAMISTTGRVEELLRDFDATLEPERKTISIRQLSGRFANLTITAHGSLVLVAPAEKRSASDVITDFITNRFPIVCRQALDFSARLAQFEAPAVHLEFSPSASGAATIELRASASGMRLAAPVAVEADDVRVATRVLLFGDTPSADVEIAAERVRLPSATSIDRLQARVLGRFQLPGPAFDLREVALTAASVAAAGVDARSVSAQIFPRTLPAIEANVVGTVLGATLAVQAEAQLSARRAIARFRGDLAPEILDVVSARVGTNVRRFFDFKSLFVDRGEVRFGDGFAFERLDARVMVPQVFAYGITLNDGRATVQLTPGFFHAPEAFARLGEHFASGSYEQDFRTNRYRFLLAGQLRPLAISGWFREWWPNFFRQFDFTAAPVAAEVDVGGAWRDGGKSHVFVFADVDQPVVRGTALDRVRSRLFIRPGFVDGLETLATRGEQDATGVFTFRADRSTGAWQTLDLDLASTIDLKTAAQIIGPVGTGILGPFQLAQPPQVRLRGQFAGPAAEGGARTRLQIAGRTAGDFRYHGFPLQDVAFNAAVDGDEISLNDITGSFGGGTVTGQVSLWGASTARRLGFDFALEDAGLGPVAGKLGEFFAARKNEPPPPPGKFIQQKANVRISLAASAEGDYSDVFSYRGSGSAVLRGAEIGQVPLLGALSELLRFTALRFTEARSNFKIEGPKLVFPQVTIRGANSAIDGHGTYALDRQQLDFNAKLFPFQESDSILKTVVGAVLSPLSNAFEVRLTGAFDKPEWTFVNGPTNFLRSITGQTESPDNPDKPADSPPVPPGPGQGSPPPPIPPVPRG